MQVTINNFQSLKSVSFEVKGLTVITGPNNTGKSACARAVAGAFSNPRGHSYVRQGEKKTSVQIDLDDGNTLIWEKGKGVNRYQINDTVIDKVGTSIPDEVAQLKVTSVDVDGKVVFPQIARQFEQIFLLDMPPSVLSSALSDVDLIKTLESASSLARADVRSLKSTLKVKRGDLETEKSKIPLFEDVDRADDLVSNVYKVDTEIKTLTSQIDQLDVDLKERERLMLTIQNLSEVEGITFPKVDLSKINQIKDLIALKREINKLKIMEMMIGVGLESFPHLPDPNKVKDPSKLERVLKRRNDLLESIQTLSSVEVALPDIPVGLDEDLALSERRVTLQSKILLAEEQVARLTQELHDLKSTIGEVCPLCEQGVKH